jgi:hypothetical protein
MSIREILRQQYDAASHFRTLSRYCVNCANGFTKIRASSACRPRGR